MDNLMKQPVLKTCRLFAIAFAGFAFFSLPSLPVTADAYVLPAPYLLERVSTGINPASRFQAIKTLRIEPAGPDEDENRRGRARSFDMVVSFNHPSMFRADIRGDDLEHTHVASAGRYITLIDDVVAGRSAQWVYHFKHLFLQHSREELTDNLQSIGVRTGISSIGRLDGGIFFVVGAQYPDSTVPQLWIDRERFLPVRLVVTGASAEGEPPAAEIRFSRWSRQNGMRYPGEMTFFENGTEIQRIPLRQLDAEPAFDAGQFDIRALEAAARSKERKSSEDDLPDSAPDATPDDAPDDSRDISDEIREEIEAFRRIFE